MMLCPKCGLQVKEELGDAHDLMHFLLRRTLAARILGVKLVAPGRDTVPLKHRRLTR